MPELYISDRPLIAVLHFSAEERERFPPLRLRALLAEAALQGARFCLINADRCDMQAETMEAEIWLDGGFLRRSIARPDVAVIPARPTLRKHLQVRDWMRTKCPTVEDIGPDKADLPARLAGTPLQAYTLPQRILTADDDLEAVIGSWLAEAGPAVIKPADGNRGKRIQFILREAGQWLHRSDHESWPGSLADVARKAAAAIEGRTRYRRYFIQKYVRSVTADGRAFYMRIDVHKNGAGDWTIVKTGARLGEIGYSVGNPTNGGYGGNLEAALALRPVRPAQDIYDEARAMVLSLGQILDQYPDVHVKELGVDMVLDESDKIWLIEANMQPQSSGHNLERAAINIDYCLAVASGRLKLKRFDSPEHL